MKSIKVFFMDKRLKDVYPHATRWEVFKWRVSRVMAKMIKVAMICAAIYGAYQAGAHFDPRVVEAERIVEVEVEKPKAIPAVMKRIAKCESGDMHYRDGQIVTNLNGGHSLDIGRYQVNLKYWGKKATEMDLDLTKEADNERMALWIYENHGTEPWSASASCWR